MKKKNRKKEFGRTILETLTVLGIIAFLLISGLYGLNQVQSKTQVKYLTERILILKNQRRTTVSSDSGRNIYTDLNGPYGSELRVENGLGDTNHNYFWIEVRKLKNHTCNKLIEADVGATKVDGTSCPNQATFYFNKFSDGLGGEGNPDKGLQPSDNCSTTKPVWNGEKCICKTSSCGTGSTCSSSGDCHPCKEDYSEQCSSCLGSGTPYWNGLECVCHGNSCGIGSTCDSNGECQECEDDLSEPCSTCPNTSLPYWNGTTCVCHEDTCGVGNTCETNGTCKECKQDFSATCSSCTDDTTPYWSTSNTCVCHETTCGTGKYCKDSGTCDNCPDHADCSGGSIECDPGYELSSNTCIPCTDTNTKGACGCTGKHADGLGGCECGSETTCKPTYIENDCEIPHQDCTEPQLCNLTSGLCVDTCPEGTNPSEGYCCPSETPYWDGSNCSSTSCPVPNSSTKVIDGSKIGETNCYCTEGYKPLISECEAGWSGFYDEETGQYVDKCDDPNPSYVCCPIGTEFDGENCSSCSSDYACPTCPLNKSMWVENTCTPSCDRSSFNACINSNNVQVGCQYPGACCTHYFCNLNRGLACMKNDDCPTDQFCNTDDSVKINGIWDFAGECQNIGSSKNFYVSGRGNITVKNGRLNRHKAAENWCQAQNKRLLKINELGCYFPNSTTLIETTSNVTQGTYYKECYDKNTTTTHSPTMMSILDGLGEGEVFYFDETDSSGYAYWFSLWSYNIGRSGDNGYAVACVERCSTDKPYWDGNECVAYICPENSSKTVVNGNQIGSTYCYCNSGFSPFSITVNQETKDLCCPLGTYSTDGTTCVACATDGSATCTSCPTNTPYWIGSKSSCSQCPPNSSTTVVDGKRIETTSCYCNTGYTFNSSTKRCEKGCLNNMDCNNGLETGDNYCQITSFTREFPQDHLNYYANITGVCINKGSLPKSKTITNISTYLFEQTKNWWSGNNICLAHGKRLFTIEEIQCYKSKTSDLIETGETGGYYCCAEGKECDWNSSDDAYSNVIVELAHQYESGGFWTSSPQEYKSGDKTYRVFEFAPRDHRIPSNTYDNRGDFGTNALCRDK